MNQPVVRHRRTWPKAALHLLRRGHLYAGLLMLPWVLLYGVTAFLFNHPTAFSDQPAVSFGPDAIAGTPMGYAPAPAAVAEQVVTALQARAASGTTYTLVEPEQAKYTREFAFATVKRDGTEVSVLIEMNGSGGSVRSRDVQPPKVEPRAPFAVGRGPEGPRGRGPVPKGPPRAPKGEDGLHLPEPLHERIAATVPTILEKIGMGTEGEVAVTSVPDLAFRMSDGEKTWRVTYNAQTGAVAGNPADEEERPEISARRFLTRLHVSHGYPGEPGARTAWAVIVDAMAGIMVFWGLSGIFMWWQIKATRRIGAVVLLVSLVAAVWVGFAMHEVMTTRG
jgi:hypothetical protein